MPDRESSQEVPHRRARRGVLGAGLAALVVAGLVAGAVWQLGPRPAGRSAGSGPSAGPSATGPAPSDGSPAPPGGTPAVPSPPAPTVPVAVPESAMLRGPDAGTGFTAFDAQEGDDHGSIVMLMSYCGQGDYSPAGQHVLAVRKRQLSAGAERYVLERVTRYAGGWAARHLADLRRVLPRCRTVDLQADPAARVSLTVLATDFAGDGAVLIEETSGARTQYHAVVHRGDLEAELRIHSGVSGTRARDIATLAAQRLCAAPPRC